MRLLVIGKQGQLARALAERSSALGTEITCLGRPQLDIGDLESVMSVTGSVGCDAIINAAAYTAVDRAEQEEEQATRINGMGAGVVARVATARGVPLLHISTDYVFGGDLDRPYPEDDQTGPTNAYGRSKLAGEQATLSCYPTATIVRTSWVYSPFGTNFVRTMLRLEEAQDEIRVVADQLGSPTYVLDLADALIKVTRQRLAAPANRSLWGIFHATGAGEASWADFAEEIFSESRRWSRRNVKVRRIASGGYPTPARRPSNSRLSNEKLASTFGITLPDWRASVSACVARLVNE